MKIHELKDIFNDEDSVKLLNNIVMNRINKQNISKPVIAFKTENGSQLLIDGLIDKNDYSNKSGKNLISMIENTTGTVNKQNMDFNTFKKMFDIGFIKHDKESITDLKQTSSVGSTTIVDMFTPEQINQMLINGFYEEKCLAAGKELNVKPVAALKNIEMNENTVIIYGFSKTRENDYNFLCWVEDLSGDELEVLKMEIPANTIYNAIDNKKLEVDKNYRINEKLHVFKEAYMQEGYLVSSPKKLKEVKEKIKEYEKELLIDSFDPEIDSIKELNDASISGIKMEF